MTLKSYLWGMRISAVLSFAAWALVIWFVDPEKTGAVGQFLFYATTLLFFAGLAIMLFTWMRSVVGEENAVAYLGVSFRQGILIAILAVLLLVLQQYRVLVWWDAALTVVGILLVELYFLTRK